MRSQALPLALCIFMSFFFLSASMYATTKYIKKNENTSKNNTYEVISTSRELLKSEIDLKSITNEIQKHKSESTDLTKNMENNNLSVFSYKNKLIVKGEIQNSTGNFAAHVTPFNQTSFFKGMFYGVTLMFIALNIICFFIFEERLFVYFAAVAVAFSILFFASDGMIDVLTESSIPINSIMEACAFVITALATVVFSTRYLRLNQSYPKLKIIAIGLLIGAGISLSAAVFSEETLFVNIANTISAAAITFYLIMGILCFSKNNYAKFYVIASAIPTLFMIDFFVMNGLGISFLGTEPIHLKTAAFVQMLLLSYGIVYRMKAIKEEKELRKTEMMIFIKRQQLMNRKNVEKLMEDVYLENLIMHYDLDGLEIKLLQYISEGKENTKIARKLKMTEKEVDELTQELYHKLEISEQIQEDFNLLESQPDYIYN